MNAVKTVPLWRKILKIILWTAMACVLAVAATMMCVVYMMSPEHLTAITERAANRILDADVSVGRVELALQGRLPLLRVRVDSVTVISRPMLRLGPTQRDSLPQWADTLLTLTRFEGGLNVGALFSRKFDLYDVEFEEPAINLVTLNDSISNYYIYSYHSDERSDTVSEAPMPAISINRFSIIRPKPLKFYNVYTGEHFRVALQTLSISSGATPAYNLNVGGDIHSPSLSLYNLDSLDFGVDGSVGWNPEKPTELQLDNFRLKAGFVDATASALVDFGREIIVRHYAMSVGPTPIDSILSVIPDSLRTRYGLGADRLSTDAGVSLSVNSTGPFNLTTDSVPMADVVIGILPGKLRYGAARFRNVSGTLRAFLHGNDINEAVFEAENLNVAGPATDLTINLRASQVMDDALLEGSVKGVTGLQYLPAVVREMARGYISGRVTTGLKFTARRSMFTPDKFHRIHLAGRLAGRDLYYLSSDTANLFTAHHADLTFGTHVPTSSDSMLSAVIKVDSADILHTQYSMKVADLRLGVGVSNRTPSSDTTLVIPMGGGISIGKFYFTVLGDSIAFNMREAKGRVTMQRYKGNARQPVLGLDLDVRNISTGSPTTRFMLSGAEIHADAVKLPPREIPKAIRHAADSIARVYPDMPVDSVYKRAIEIQRHKVRGRYPRIHPQYTDAETEIIDWGTSKLVRRMLLGWDIHGNIKARRAGMFTNFFPLRNRLRNFNVEFNNDSIILTNVKYKAGSSDFQMSGVISNLKRGFTSRGYRSPLKLNFELLSDTIDINELAGSAFAGSAYAARRNEEGHRDFSLQALEDAEADSDEEFERAIGRVVENAPDSMAPLLIPRNIEANIDLRAANILYSDLLFHDLSGSVLASQGALNLHDLKARSDVGSVNLSALYSAPSARDLKFGFGLQVEDFNVQRFTRLMPALDSIMPLLRDFSGIIDADVAATCDIDSGMNLVLPTLAAAVRISGDSLRLIDEDTYRKIGKWLMFKDKQDNLIKQMNVELTVRDNTMRIYPFVFDLDRYRLGVQGYNDLALNFDYHIAVLKSPLPFKFGVNIKGNPDHYKVRLGKAHLNERQVAQSVSIVDTTRINLLAQLENVFRRGVANSRFATLDIAANPTADKIDLNSDTISRADSLVLIREGLIPAPVTPPDASDNAGDKAKDKKKGRRKSHGDDRQQTQPVAAVKTEKDEQ